MIIEKTVSLSDFKNAIPEVVFSVLYQIWCDRIARQRPNDFDYIKEASFAPLASVEKNARFPQLFEQTNSLFTEGLVTAREYERLVQTISNLARSLSAQSLDTSSPLSIVHSDDENPLERLIDNYLAIFHLADELSETSLPSRFPHAALLLDSDASTSGTASQGSVRFQIRDENASGTFVNAVKAMVDNAVIAGEALLPTERAVLFLAGDLLDQGQHLALSPIPWGLPGFRKHQSVMSVTDPGPGHLLGTVTDLAYMDGVIVHIEHLERGVKIPRTVLEPYRIPVPRVVPRICMQANRFAPVSSYVGRPMFDGTFEDSFLKTVHTFAAACSAFFSAGVTECKVSIEGMTARQSVKFMRALNANVRRSENQILSGAFCINEPLVDDRNADAPVLVSDPYEVGLLGIELAAAGHFGKVTWDGTADTYPSKCVIDQLEFWQSATLVHRAHERGLLTYFSAGFRMHHLGKVVYTGVDGVGIGGAQILRYMDYTTGNQGPFKSANIKPILELRNTAETEPRGRAARLLAKLDTLHFLNALDEKLELYREELFAAICTGKPEAVLEEADLNAIGRAERHVFRTPTSLQAATARYITRPSIFSTSHTGGQDNDDRNTGRQDDGGLTSLVA